MNYKLLFPTYRNRHRFVERSLATLSKEGKLLQGLNLGAGEGDYDGLIAQNTNALISCDINEEDVAFAKATNANVPNLSYQVENALATTFQDNTFDLIVSCEVIEHVGEPEKMIQEISRILKPGGHLVMTFPRQNFPWTYDLINKILLSSGKKNISQGAYAFGHDYLINDKEYQFWLEKYDLEIVQQRNMSGHLIGLLEAYWTGIIQSILKANSSNVNMEETTNFKLRPSSKKPWLTVLTDFIINIDFALFKNARQSVGRGYIVKKKS